MKTAYAILILNFIFSIAFFWEHWLIGAILTFIWLISAIGLIGFHRTGKKAFAYLSYCGFAPFFPIGLLAIIGIRRKLEQEEEFNLSGPEPISKLYFSRRFLRIWLILGLCLIAAQIITQFWIKFPNPVGAVGLVFVIVSLTLKKSVLIEIYEDHFTYKPGVLSSKKRINFDDIQNFRQVKKQLRLVLKGDKGDQKIMLELMEPSDVEKFKKWLSRIET